MQLAVALFISVVIVILGIISIFFKDVAWAWTEYSNRAKGVQPTRTPEWETATTIGGVISIVAGVILIFMSLGAWG